MDQEYFQLSTVVREKFGKGASRLLRKNGNIPAIVYGNKSIPKPITLSSKDISKRLHSRNFMTTVLMLDLGKEKIRVLPKDYQLDPVTDNLIHVDFLQISEYSTISVQIPVHFFNENKCPGLKQGGNLNIVCHEIALLCPANNIPDSISIDLNGLKIGDSTHISDVSLPPGTSPVSHTNLTIASITPPTAKDSGSET
ncbi:MAG: 50S ribosomal protein L25/general stress protein Ctc [Candidatus Liberibacter ctenarytainae]|uniref:Large ribosomal subunit protein bL25 n=1 Tax=Candidatus Liberibacter ctenarytainae TaxID=2020335 RepID=A0A937AL89_9HYPH|nr:50S ribosomal protein L25/general stress protein Ctc [Candidatus Liberibacter ctenarytainae]